MMINFDSMKKRNNTGIIFFALILFLLLVPGFIYAGIGGDPGGDVDTPIDGGLSILIAAGVGYGVKKIRDERKQRLNKLP